jgi:glycosyltransferase involved in cell wall biosynthesis
VSPLRALVVTTVHRPLDARIHDRQIRTLVRSGWSVTYAAPFTATTTRASSVLDGVRTVDLPRATGRHRVRALLAARRLVGRALGRVDVVLLHDPELLLTVVGRRRLPGVVLDVHEDLSGSLVDRAWLPSRLRPAASRAARILERWAERRLSLLLAEEAYAARFEHPHPVVRNLPWLPHDSRELASGADRVVYVGRLSRGRGLDELLAVGAALRARGGPTLELIGAPDPEVSADLERAVSGGDVRWSGYLPSDEALARVDGAVAGLCLLHDLPNYRVSLPTKVVEYLARGVPVITTPLPYAAALVERSMAGTVVPFGAVGQVVDEVLDLAGDAGRRLALGSAGREFVRSGWCWDEEQRRFLDELHRAADHAVAVWKG